LLSRRGRERNKRYNFNHLLNQDFTQEEVFRIVGQRVIDGVLNGYNGTIFAYGMTGTGKTYSMLGKYNYSKEEDSNEDRGIIPRSLEKIFDHTREDFDNEYSISVGFIQIYMEMIQDLLEPDNQFIKIRELPGKGVYVDNTTWVSVKNVQQSMRTFKFGEQNRATAFTNLNAHSSRSHAVFLVKIEKRKAQKFDEAKKKSSKTDETIDGSLTYSTLFLVDLAGSERVKKSKATAGRLDEAKKINFSLSCLGNCIQALSEKKKGGIGHVPFRDSKLTRLLQDSLGGNSKTSMIV
jgi:kinesin family member 5